MKLVTATLAALLAGAAAQAAEAPTGALACSGCHPAASGVDAAPARLIGMKAEGIEAAMQQFRSGARAATVMDRIAKGFTDQETLAIAAWYAAHSN